MHKIFCFNNGGPHQWLTAIAIADDGHILAQHICSDEYFMRHDLGLTSDWKHENYDAHFGVGNWELVWIDDPKKSPELDAAIELLKALPKNEALADHEATRAGATVTFSDGSQVHTP